MDLGLNMEIKDGELVEEEIKLDPQDEAFLKSQSGSKELSFGGPGGKPTALSAFNTHRQVAAQKLGMEFFNMGEEALEEFQERETYNGIFQDAVIVVYLCAHPISVAKKALRVPAKVMGEALTWAENCDVRVGNTRHAELLSAFGDIIGEIISSVAEIDETGMESRDDSLGK